jgi:16S rRNA (cytosine967-C5)-methyltransferase
MSEEGGARTATRVTGAGVTEARHVAAQICSDLRRGELLDGSFDRQTTRLDPRDRRFTRELVYGMLRRRSWLDELLEARVRGGLSRLDPDVHDLLRLGAYQLLYMRSVPAYAAIAQTVELAKRRHGVGPSRLANAVLRRLDREGGGAAGDALHVSMPADPIDALALVESHPRWLVARWIARWGDEETRRLLQANNTEPPLVARPVHAVREQVEAMLEGAGITVADAPLVNDSILLASPISALTELGAFRQGLFHLQDPASTLVTKYAAIPEGAAVADICAAPGGKTIELARRAGAVFASDLSFARLRRVLENKQRMELSTVFPYVADARRPAIRSADVVLIDAPCTGTGTFRRHPDARWRIKTSDLAVMASLQREILRAASTIVSLGGLLVYSTCSLETEENDTQIERFLTEHKNWRLDPPVEGAVPSSVLDAGRLRVLPQRHGTDGAFAARLRRVA